MTPILMWLGHSCFRLGFGEGGSVVFDPYARGSVPGAELPDYLSADLVLCSHGHGDHIAADRVELSGRETKFTVTHIDTWHDPEQGKLRGANRISVVEFASFRAAHLGDLGCALAEEQLTLLEGLDLLLVPVGGHFTIGPAEAKQLIDRLQPRVVVPMHYRRGDMGYPIISELGDFTALFDGVTEIPGSVLELGPDLRGLYVMNL